MIDSNLQDYHIRALIPAINQWEENSFEVPILGDLFLLIRLEIPYNKILGILKFLLEHLLYLIWTYCN